jgi:hypothetical protein
LRISGLAVISGAARGVDVEGMMAAFEAGGKAASVLPDSVARTAVSARYRDGLVSGRLVLISPYDPDARWLPFTAMERNKIIYALSDAALVVSSAADGGTWTGAIEALDAARVPVYVKAHGSVKEGSKLPARGGRPFSEGQLTGLRSLFEPVASEPTLFTAPIRNRPQNRKAHEFAITDDSRPAASIRMTPGVLPAQANA